jgi:RHS repeat-associated protein
MTYIVFFLFFITSLFASTSVTENDPSTIVEGVSVITGDFYTFEEDLVIQGKEPIPFRRFYLSGDGHWQNLTQHFVCTFLVQADCFQVTEPNGTVLLYALTGHEKGLRRFDTTHFNANSQGVSNTASEEISARTNLKNQYLLLEKDAQRLTLYAANGTRRCYRAMHGQKPETLLGQRVFQAYHYMLESEEYSNGNRGNYFWDKSNHLIEIRTSNRSNSKIYAQVKMPTKTDPSSNQRIGLNGSDGSSLFVQKKEQDKNGKEHIQIISSSWQSEQTFHFKKHHESGLHLLRSISLPQGRKLWIEYNDAERHRVKSLSACVGSDDRPIKTHSFFYDLKKRTTRVSDAYGNQTSYFWNEQDRLTQIDRFQGDTFHSSDCFIWNGTHLCSKAFLDGDHQPVFARTFTYDKRGNVLEETLRGNLSGEGSPLHLKNGIPIEDGVESCTVRTTYNDRNLPIRREDTNDLVTLTEYRSDACLPTVKSLCDRNGIKIRQTYDYDQDLICIRETVDDGVCKLVKEITPLQQGPFIGLPYIIDEKADHTLLKRTVLHYTTGAHVSKKDIYDADGVLRYSLQFEYDTKGRLLRETNPLAQEAISRYDEVGNRIYFKDFSGKLETYLRYDFSNRLVEKEEIGCDGIQRLTHYAYDYKHNLISEIDPQGHETQYAYDVFGRRTEIRLPPIHTPHGEKLLPILRQSYDSSGNVCLHIDPDGAVTKSTYNAVYNKPIDVIHPDGNREKYVYDLNGTLKTHTDPEGLVTTYSYDYLSRILSKTISSQHNGILSEEHFEYQGYHLMAKTDAEGHRTVYAYDRAGRKILEECCGESIRYSYDTCSRIHLIQKGDLCTLFEYDLLDRVIEERQESSTGELLRKERYEYDSAGNKSAIIRFVAGQEAREENLYDSLNRLIWRKNALGAIETNVYDDGCKPRKTHTDPMGLQTIETYDAHNRVIVIEKRKGRTLSLTEKFYDVRGNRHIEIDTVYGSDGSSRKVQTRWEYDTRQRLIALIEADDTLDAKTTCYTYTPNGKKAKTLKPDGTVLFYEYDDLGHLSLLHSSDGTLSHRMLHNRLGYLIQSDALKRVVDARGRIISETFPSGYCIENRFNSQGQRIQCCIPQADCLIEYDCNALDLCNVARKTLAGITLYAHSYRSRDLSGNLLQEELLTGKNVCHTMDLCSRNIQIEAPHFSQSILDHDAVGNIRRMLIQEEETAYTYDDLYQLISETGIFAHSYTYDSLFNRLAKDDESYHLNTLNQVISHFEYDKNGNPICYGDTHFTYDALDRLIRIKTPCLTQIFTYDSFHRCLSKTTLYDESKETLLFLYDDQNEIGAFDEQLQIQELRILGHAPHAEIKAAIAIELKSSIYAPIHDLQGNIAALLALGKTEPTFYRYSAFGEELIKGKNQNPWRFSSKRTDERTQLVSFGRRFYHPVFGRWLTPDPAGFTDGMNLYAFVHNNPLTHFDEYGLLDCGIHEKKWIVEADIKNYLNGGYKFENHYYHYTPKTYSLNTSANKLRGEIVLFTGIRTTYDEHCDMVRYTSKLGGNLPVHGIHMPTHGFYDDVDICKRTLETGMNSTVLHGERYFREASERVGPDGRILAIGHSGGAMHIYFGGMRLPREIRDKIVVRTFAPAKFISTDDFNTDLRQYRSSGLDSLMLYHKLFHRNEYDQALNSGLLIEIPAHASRARVPDHDYMSPTFKYPISLDLAKFNKKYECR